MCFASKPRFFFSEIIELASLRHGVDYFYVLVASGEGIGHPLRQDVKHFLGFPLKAKKVTRESSRTMLKLLSAGCFLVRVVIDLISPSTT